MQRPTLAAPLLALALLFAGASPAWASNATEWTTLSGDMKLQLIEGMAIGMRAATIHEPTGNRFRLDMQARYDFVASHPEDLARALDRFYADPQNIDVAPWDALMVCYDDLRAPDPHYYRPDHHGGPVVIIQPDAPRGWRWHWH